MPVRGLAGTGRQMPSRDNVHVVQRGIIKKSPESGEAGGDVSVAMSAQPPFKATAVIPENYLQRDISCSEPKAGLSARARDPEGSHTTEPRALDSLA